MHELIAENTSGWFELVIWKSRLLGRYNAPTKYMSSLSVFVPLSWSPRFVPVSASRKVTNALLGSFGAAGLEGMATSIAEVAGIADEETIFAETFTVFCSLSGVCDNEVVSLGAWSCGNFAVSCSFPGVCSNEDVVFPAWSCGNFAVTCSFPGVVANE